MGAAGLLEGGLTQHRAFEFLSNVFGTQTFSEPLRAFLKDNLEWMNEQVAAFPTDEYWQHVGLSIVHWRGVYAGYNATAPPEEALDEEAFFRGTLQGDLSDLCSVFPNCLAGGAPSDSHPPWRGGASHCSALVKPVRLANGSYSDLFAGHTTWAGFESMTRVYKHYDFAITSAKGGAYVPGRHVVFSSYPSCTVSTDDWYQLSPSRLAVLETTIDNNNASLWVAVTPQTVPYWIRNQVANRLATDAASWHAIFSRENSGTYNNEVST